MAENFSGIRAAIIDLDGTMVDTAPDFQVAVNRMRAEFDLPPLELAVIISFVGKGTENLIARVLACDLPPMEAERLFERAIASYMRSYQGVNGQFSSLYPGVIAGLDRMRDMGLRLACVTNKPIGFAAPLLELKGLRDYFEIVYGGDSLARKKPDPLPLLQACDDFKLRPAQVVAIGDSSNDAEAARAAGCRVLMVPYGYNHGKSIQEVESDGIVSTLLDAAHLLSN